MAPNQWVIFNVENHVHSGGNESWVFDVSIQGNSDFKRMIFPSETPEWRAAEYDMPHATQADMAAIWDLIFHEPFMSPPPPMPKIKGVTSIAPVYTHLYNAASKADAKAAHLQRVADVKANAAQVVWGANAVYGDSVNRKVGVPVNIPHTLPVQAAGTIHPLFAQVLSNLPDPLGVSAKQRHVQNTRVGLGLESAPPIVVPTINPQYMDPSIQRRVKELGS